MPRPHRFPAQKADTTDEYAEADQRAPQGQSVAAGEVPWWPPRARITRMAAARRPIPPWSATENPAHRIERGTLAEYMAQAYCPHCRTVRVART